MPSPIALHRIVMPVAGTIYGGSRDTTPDGKQAILIISDSTGAGSNNNTGNGPAPAAGTAYYYRRVQNDIVAMTSDVYAAPMGSQYPSFCTKYFNGSGKKAVIIPSGVGGSNFAPRTGETGNWTTADTLYSSAVSDAQNTLTILGLTRLKAIFITSLGINDARGATALGTIQTEIASLISRLQTDFPGVPILLEQIGRSNITTVDARIAAVRNYLRQTAIDNINVYMVNGLPSMVPAGGYGADLLHPNQNPGNNTRGEIYARWMLNTTYSKWSRGIIASHFDDLSTARKNAIATFIDANLTAYLDHDCMLNLTTTVKENTYVDWAMMCIPADLGFSFTANTCITSNGVSTYYRPGYNPGLNALRASQNDIIAAAWVKNNYTPAATTAVIFGGTDTTKAISCFQTSTSLLAYRSNDFTTTNYAGETLFGNNASYGVYRNGGTKGLIKNGVSINSDAVASVGLPPQVFLGCNNSNGTAASFINADFQFFRASKYTGYDWAAFNTALSTFLSAW